MIKHDKVIEQTMELLNNVVGKKVPKEVKLVL